jgi:N-acetylglucosamine kinase-like BadF-type ATPase
MTAPAFFVAGIDGGQSSTTAVIGDRTGRTIGIGRAGPADEVGVRPDSTRLRDALRNALSDAAANAGLPPDVRFAAIVAGISGYEGRVYGRPADLPTARLVLAHDAPVAHAGALGGEPGVVVIAGTGSVVYATGGPSERMLGGWGYLFGDEGSAFWLVREALALLMRRADENRPVAEETQAVCAFFGLPSLRQVVRAFYAGDISRDRLAAFVPAALAGSCFRAIADGGADRLAALAAAAVADGAPPTIACVGGMFADDAFRARVAAGIHRSVPGARVVKPRHDPAAGALMLAYREANAG